MRHSISATRPQTIVPDCLTCIDTHRWLDSIRAVWISSFQFRLQWKALAQCISSPVEKPNGVSSEGGPIIAFVFASVDSVGRTFSLSLILIDEQSMRRQTSWHLDSSMSFSLALFSSDLHHWQQSKLASTWHTLILCPNSFFPVDSNFPFVMRRVVRWLVPRQEKASV